MIVLLTYDTKRIMNKARKVELLYKIAKGQGMGISPQERKELRKYKVQDGESSFFATKANISAYVSAVDKGARTSFYDWCINNGKADKRRRGSSKKTMASNRRQENIGAMLAGGLLWAAAIFWILNGTLSGGSCLLVGGLISALVYKCSRRNAMFSLIVLPCIITVVFYMYF